jgi:catechol 2,3-dioxygenase-like lactoylglutathione lyase family enzyme
MFDHLSLGVQDLDRSVKLYEAALAPLGLVLLWRTERAAGFGPHGFTGEAPFALVVPSEGSPGPTVGSHLAFSASCREAVRAFHGAALVAGAMDEGPPGIRDHYTPGYFAAFLRDPDGHRLEAVFHEPVD